MNGFIWTAVSTETPDDCSGTLTADKSMCEIILMMLAISFAAVIHRILLSPLTVVGSRFLSALKIAAWWRQIVDV